jgi:hypothetical protein
MREMEPLQSLEPLLRGDSVEAMEIAKQIRRSPERGRWPDRYRTQARY